MMRRPGFIGYRNFRYLKMAGWLTLLSVIGYWLTKPSGGEAYGGTWFGYVLGILSALIILIHMWYGIRKRRTPRIPDKRDADRRKMNAATNEPYDPERRKANRRTHLATESWRHGGTLQGWLSAHIHFGTILIVLATLHTGFNVGWNIHTLAYVLMLLVIASGLYGTHAYVRYPRLLTENNADESIEDLLLKIAELDELARFRALSLPDEVNTVVWRARTETRLGGTFFEQLRGTRPDCPTDFAVARIHALGKVLTDGDAPRLMRDLYAVLVQKQRLVEKVRDQIRLNARMQFWLYLHAPLSLALLGALLAHVLTILIYW